MTSSHSSEAVQPSLSRKSLRIAAILEIIAKSKAKKHPNRLCKI